MFLRLIKDREDHRIGIRRSGTAAVLEATVYSRRRTQATFFYLIFFRSSSIPVYVLAPLRRITA